MNTWVPSPPRFERKAIALPSGAQRGARSLAWACVHGWSSPAEVSSFHRCVRGLPWSNSTTTVTSAAPSGEKLKPLTRRKCMACSGVYAVSSAHGVPGDSMTSANSHRNDGRLFRRMIGEFSEGHSTTTSGRPRQAAIGSSRSANRITPVEPGGELTAPAKNCLKPRGEAPTMRRMLRPFAMRIPATMLATVLLCSAAPARAAGAAAPVTWEDIARARQAHDFFALRDRLARPGAAAGLPGRVAAAFVANAFNRPADSNAAISGLLHEHDVPASVRAALHLLAVENH